MTPDDFRNLEDELARMRQEIGVFKKWIKDLWPIKPTADGSSAAVVLCKPTGNASGGGKYVGRVWIAPTADILATGNLSASDLGTDPGSNNALILNCDEIGQSTHDLTGGTVKVTHFIGVLLRQNTDGTYVVAINGIDWENCP